MRTLRSKRRSCQTKAKRMRNWRAMGSSTVHIDLVQGVAESVPGAVAGDLLFPGDTRAVVVGGIFSVAVSQFIFLDEGKLAREIREVYRKAPLLGFGVAYGAARVGGLDRNAALIAGVVGGLILGMMRMRRAPPMKRVCSDDAGTQVYPHVNPSGDPPGAAAAAIDPAVI